MVTWSYLSVLLRNGVESRMSDRVGIGYNELRVVVEPK